MASMTSLNKEEEAAQAHQEAMEEAEATATDPSAAAAVAAARTISRRGEEARGGFVLRAKSDEYPSRRRSLVERTGMKTLVQVVVLSKKCGCLYLKLFFSLHCKVWPPPQTLASSFLLGATFGLLNSVFSPFFIINQTSDFAGFEIEETT